MSKLLIRTGLHAGFVLVVVVLGSALLFGKESGSAIPNVFLLLMILGLWAGVVQFDRVLSRELDATVLQMQGEMRQLEEETRSLFLELQQDFSAQFSIARQEVDQVQGLLADTVERLIASFGDMDRNISEQKSVALTLVEGHHDLSDHEAETLSFAEFAHETSETLSTFVETSIETSRVADDLLESIRLIETQVQSADNLLKEMQSISHQTNLLSRNVANGAARAGESEKAFSGFAEDVSKLSQQASGLTDEIRKNISGITASITAARKNIESIASKDLSFAIRSKDRLQGMSLTIEAMNSKAALAIQRMSEIASEASSNVSVAVTALQFQDMTSQVLAHIRHRLDRLSNGVQAFQSICNMAVETDESAGRMTELRLAMHETRESLISLRANPVKQVSTQAGDVDLF